MESLPARGHLPAGAELDLTGGSQAVAGSVAPPPLEERLAAHVNVVQRGARSATGPLYGRAWTAACLLSDGVMLLLAVGAALLGAGAAGVEAGGSTGVWVFPPLAMGLMALRGLYKPRLQIRLIDDVGRVLSCVSIAAMSIISVAALADMANTQADLMARVWLFSMIYVAGGRLVFGLAQRQARALGGAGRPTLIVGAGQVAAQVERRLLEQPELGLQPVGFVDANPAPDEHVPGRRAPLLGGPDQLDEIVARTGAQHVIMAFLSSRGSDARMVPIVRKCDELGLKVSLVPRLFENMNVRAELEHLGGMPLFGLSPIRTKSWHFTVKHVLDRVVAALLVVLLAPILLAAAAAVKATSPGPVFFRQRRVGRDGQPFDLLKFRSMRVSEEPGDPGPNVLPFLPRDTAPGGVEGESDRRTPIGRFLRRTSLDELPQLFNVLRGEMSIVGPRPERPEYVELFERRIDRYDDRHRVKAGITGWAQVHGLRGQTCLSDRIEWDNFYIENWSLTLDFKILLMTVGTVLHDAE